MSGCILFHLPVKGLSTSSPRLLPAGGQAERSSQHGSAGFCTPPPPFLTGLLSLSVAIRWHLHRVQFRSNKCSIYFQDDSQFIFCSNTVLCTSEKSPRCCCSVLLVSSAVAGGCTLLESAVSLGSHVSASTNFRSK